MHAEFRSHQSLAVAARIRRLAGRALPNLAAGRGGRTGGRHRSGSARFLRHGSGPPLRRSDAALRLRRESQRPRLLVCLYRRPSQTGMDAGTRTGASRSHLAGIFEAAMPPRYSPRDAARFKALRLDARSGASGVSGLRTSFERPLWICSFDGRTHSPDRVRQPGEPDARPGHRARTGARHPALHRCLARAHRPPTAYGEPGAVGGRRCRGTAALGGAGQIHHHDDQHHGRPRSSRPLPRLARAGLHGGAGVRRLPALRSCAGYPGRSLRFDPCHRKRPHHGA